MYCMQIYSILADNGKFGCGIYVLSDNPVQIEITELDVVVHVEDEAVFIIYYMPYYSYFSGSLSFGGCAHDGSGILW